MRSLVIDANIFYAYCVEMLTGEINKERTDSPVGIFDILGTKAVAFLDEGGQIENEWRQLLNFAPEWFAEWLANSLANGLIYEIEPYNDQATAKRYRQLGLPSGRDIWYIKTSFGIRNICKRNNPILISEDIDFYDPKLKNHPRKHEIFLNEKGDICKELKRDNIELRCILNAKEEVNKV